jgi:hypothetical protein
MAEKTSIPVTVDPKMSVTSAESAHDLEKAFDDMFGPLSDRPKPEPKEPEPKEPKEPKDSAPPATTEEEPPPKETETEPEPEPEHKAEGESTPETTKVETRGETHPDDEADEELDSYALHPNSTPEVVDQFRAVRGMAKRFKKELTEARSKLDSSGKELESLKGSVRPVSDPEVQKELESLRTFRQRHEIYDDSAFQIQYEQPVRNQFDAIINEVKSMAPDKAAAEAWEAEIRKMGPDRISKQYWNEGVIGQVADPIDRDRMVRKVSTLLELQGKRNQFAAELAAQPDKYQQYQHETAADYWKDFSVQAEDEAKKLTANLGEWAMPKDPGTAKSQSERAAIEAHNKTYQDYETRFKEMLTDSATNGPRGMVRTAVLAIEGIKAKSDLDATRKELGKIKGELQKAREELNKIAGARSRVAQSTGGTGAANGNQASTRKAGQSLDSAFNDFFGKQ